MPYRPEIEAALPSVCEHVTTSDWQRALPVLRGRRATLRALRASDAASLFAMLSSEEVSRFINPPPSTVEAFEKFIAWTERQRAAGTYVCFAVALPGSDEAIGLFQVRQVGTSFDVAEWGFALGSAFWGSGVFAESASLVLEFVFDTLQVRRLEARAAVQNGRGNGALRKLGAVPEATLRESFARHGRRLDQMLYAILDTDWRARGGAFRGQPALSVQIH
jgi:ribosomal-protein-alanine N-acetyltransferase